ncbi:reverse transcriptase domain-containing protein [Tanacetum coccineum]
MDDEPIWAADRIVAPTLGSAITIPETANEFSIKALFDRLLGEIRAFSQHENESLTDAWLRMKEMLRNCHGHNLSKGNIIKIFYHGLSEITQEVLNAAAGGIFLYKTPNQAYQLLEDKVLLKLDWAKNQKTKSSLKKTVAFVDEGSSNSNTDRIMARMDAMTLKMDAQYKELQTHAKKTKPDLDEDDIPMSREEEAKFMQTFRKTRFYNDYRDRDSNRDNWRSNERSSYNRDNYRSNTDDKPYDLQKQFNDFMKSQQSTNAFVKETFMDLKTQLETVAKNHQASIQNLETKFDRLADKQSGRPSGSLPSNTQPNPKGHNSKAYQPPQSRNEHVNAVFTRSGKSYNPPVNSNDQQTNSENPINFDDSDEEDEEPTPQPKIQNPKPVKETTLPKPYKPKIPYPQRLRKEKMEAQYGKFLDVIRAVRINVPLIDVLAGMPNYGKFLKELISNKHKIEQISAAFLSDESSAMIQNKVPPKLGDPGSFLIPCNFNKTFSCNALADLGASINLMPYSLYAKLSLENLKPTKMSVRLADRSFQYPVGIAKNMLVEVGKFTFPADFVILEMEEDSKVPLILGRPFLHTADAVIRVKQKQLNLGVGTERMIFNIDSAMKHSYSNDDTCFSIDVIDEILEEDFDALLDEGSKILHSIEGTLLEEEIFAEFDEFMAMTADENSDSESDTEDPPFKKITINTDYKIKTSLEEPLMDLELKPLPGNLEYVFLEEPSFLPVIISSQLSKEKKNKLISVLKKHKQAFAWKTTDIPGIFPSFCKHKIQLLDDKKPVVQKQRRLNPNMQEVVKKEIVKLLDTGIIYPIADSPWVSPIHCVPCVMQVISLSYLILSKTIVHTDHSALRHLFKKHDAKPRLIRWILLLQEFDIEIKDRKGEDARATKPPDRSLSRPLEAPMRHMIWSSQRRNRLRGQPGQPPQSQAWTVYSVLLSHPSPTGEGRSTEPPPPPFRNKGPSNLLRSEERSISTAPPKGKGAGRIPSTSSSRKYRKKSLGYSTRLTCLTWTHDNNDWRYQRRDEVWAVANVTAGLEQGDSTSESPQDGLRGSRRKALKKRYALPQKTPRTQKTRTPKRSWNPRTNIVKMKTGSDLMTLKIFKFGGTMKTGHTRCGLPHGIPVSRKPRNWFSKLPASSIDGFEELRRDSV